MVILGPINLPFVVGHVPISVKICPLLLGPHVSHWHQYGDMLQHNFTWLASTTVYIAIVLPAMQVGLDLDELKGNGSSVAASHGYTTLRYIIIR